MVHLSFVSLLTPLLSAVQFAEAGPSVSTVQACKDIDGALPRRLSWPIDLDYITETQEYWSTALRDLKPACVVHPADVSEVSTVVQVLNKYPDVDFSAKSGGHDPNPGHGSVQDGVLVAMRDMSGATYDAETGLATIKPGGTWNDVIGDLEPYGVTVVGGRLGIVGVGGYLLQGGISFLSAQYGLAADSVVGWETVMPNGSVVNIDAGTQPDLSKAMRGSGSQFGIVTQFVIEAHPIQKVWGGLRIYTNASRDALTTALHNFVPSAEQDPKAAVIFTDILAVGSTPIIIVYYFYDGSTPPTDGILAEFLAVPALADQTSTRTYSDLLQSNGAEAALLMSRVSFRTFTLPYIPDYPGLYSEIHSYWASIVDSYLDNPVHLTAQCSIDFQPLPSLIGQHSQERGGNAMGLSGSDPNRLILELQCSWASAVDDEIVYDLTREVTEWLEMRIPEWNTQAELGGDAYMPYFMNDAMGDQNVTGSYRSYEKLKALQREIDAQGLFRTRSGGFKY
ncbi:hypothetical protein BKA67DRAFT_541041 [Truncatella angustata]|uniref:FAD-binding PCMH-type domain-containing protein n=1 Tax=Truncatella angustata TaxID=152316 RepID=A0A9P8RMD6_9PEZI|nr:uncharacterized protein BKA67DRAFT_541041 [Truncatella angustata]KAH6646050.1 hypothetical protein BKA67DRAFT_541041 [Truncatella angustata]